MENNVDIYKVAQVAGVSKSTVSRALNNEYGVSEKTRQKILRVADEMKYKLNTAARDLGRGETRNIGILHHKKYTQGLFAHPVRARKIDGILHKCRELDYDPVIFYSELNQKENIIHIAREKNLSGIILLDEVDSEIAEVIQKYEIPYVLLNWKLDNELGQYTILTNTQHAIEKGTNALLEKGYTDICMIDWIDQKQGNSNVKDAFLKTISQHGSNPKGTYIKRLSTFSGDDLERFILNDTHRAYFCTSSYTALHLLRSCIENRISVPQELAVISYDYFSHFQYAYPALSGVAQRFFYMGERAVEMLDGALNQREQTKYEEVDVDIVEAESY